MIQVDATTDKTPKQVKRAAKKLKRRLEMQQEVGVRWMMPVMPTFWRL